MGGLSISYGQQTPESFALPTCELQDANAVLRDAVASTRRQRARERGEDALTGASSVFSQEELMQLQEAFASQDPTDAGFIRSSSLGLALQALGTAPTDEDVESLCAELGESQGVGEGQISFTAFAGVLARLKM